MSMGFTGNFKHNELQELKGNIRVFCRVRPVIESMDDPSDPVVRGTTDCVRILNSHTVEISRNQLGPKDSKSCVGSVQRFQFDA